MPTTPTSSRCVATHAPGVASCCRPLVRGADRVTFRYVGRRRACGSRTSPSRRMARWRRRAADGVGASVGIRWSVTIQPGESREISWTVWSSEHALPGTGRTADSLAPAGASAAADALAPADLFPPRPRVSADEGAAAYRAWTSSTTSVDTDNELFDQAIARSIADLRLLLNDGPDGEGRYLAAGVPWFATLFGRDAIITSLQLLAFRPQLAVETLEVLAARQATTRDDWHDAEPGKILHELAQQRDGPGGRAARSRRTTARSTQRRSGWSCSVRPPTGPAIAVCSTASGRMRSPRSSGSTGGATSTATGSSSTAGARPAGSTTRAGRIRATRSAIGAASWRSRRSHSPRSRATSTTRSVRMAGARARSAARTRWPPGSRRDAAALRERFEAAFWVHDQSYYAMALDGAKRPADAIASNAGHCLWSGIVAPERAPAVGGAPPRPRRCSPAGESGPTPPASRGSTRSATTPARSGRTTRRSPRPA